MPFTSKAQWRWAFANDMPWARRWAHKTKEKKKFRQLPKYVKGSDAQKAARRAARAQAKKSEVIGFFAHIFKTSEGAKKAWATRKKNKAGATMASALHAAIPTVSPRKPAAGHGIKGVLSTYPDSPTGASDVYAHLGKAGFKPSGATSADHKSFTSFYKHKDGRVAAVAHKKKVGYTVSMHTSSKKEETMTQFVSVFKDSAAAKKAWATRRAHGLTSAIHSDLKKLKNSDAGKAAHQTKLNKAKAAASAGSGTEAAAVDPKRAKNSAAGKLAHQTKLGKAAALAAAIHSDLMKAKNSDAGKRAHQTKLNKKLTAGGTGSTEGTHQPKPISTPQAKKVVAGAKASQAAANVGSGEGDAIHAKLALGKIKAGTVMQVNGQPHKFSGTNQHGTPHMVDSSGKSHFVHPSKVFHQGKSLADHIAAAPREKLQVKASLAKYNKKVHQAGLTQGGLTAAANLPHDAFQKKKKVKKVDESCVLSYRPPENIKKRELEHRGSLAAALGVIH